MAKYNLIGKRFLRKYTAEESTPAYMSTVAAQTLVDRFCNVPWEPSDVRDATCTRHTNAHDEEGVKGLDANVLDRERFDAALFCADHVGGQHRAYANAAVYRYVLPDGTLPSLTKLTAKVTGDAYNAVGARIVLLTNSTGVIPMDCATVRGDVTGGIKATGVAQRETREISGKSYWYPKMESAVFSADPEEGEVALPSGGIQLQKYLFVFVLQENYNSVRGNWLEGSSYLTNLVEIETDAAITGWTDGGTIDLTADPTKEFNVVKGGVMAQLPDGDAGIRALTLQRTGDEFVRNRIVTSTGLYSRAKVPGIRVLDVISTDAVFREKILDSVSKNVHVMPAIGYVVKGTSTLNISLGTITGDFSDGTFTDLPGLFIYMIRNGSYSLVRLNQSLQEHAAGQTYTNLANVKSKLTAAGGIGCVGIVTVWASTGVTWKLNIFPKNQIAATSDGIVGDSIIFGFSGDYWESEIKDLVVHDSSFTQKDEVFAVTYYGDTNVGIAPCCAYFNHDQEGKTITALGANQGGLKDRSVSYVGTITAIRPVNFTTDLNTPAFIVSGQLQSVGGVPCQNCAIVRFPNFGVAQVTVPDCDPFIAPDTYQGFAVSCPVTFTPNISVFYVTGSFRKLGTEKVEVAAKVVGTRILGLDLEDNTRPPEYFLVTNASGSDTSAIWIDDNGPIIEGGDLAEDVFEHPKEAVTDAQSAFGLRTLYSRLSLGSILPVTKKDADIGDRPGAAFCVRGETIDVKVGPDDDDVVQAKCWNLSTSVLVVPFSCPRDFLARKIRLEWDAVAATSGAKVNVWIKRGSYEGYPTSYPKAIFTGDAKAVGGWELVGQIEPEDDTSGSVELDVSPLDCEVATLLFTAFVSQDDFNPASDMTLTKGIGNVKINSVSGEVSGLDSGFRPDITLIG